MYEYFIHISPAYVPLILDNILIFNGLFTVFSEFYDKNDTNNMYTLSGSDSDNIINWKQFFISA